MGIMGPPPKKKKKKKKKLAHIVFVAKDICAMVSTLSNGVILDTIQVTLEIKVGCTNWRRLALYMTVTVTL